jgi:hypothetical protein
MQKTTLIILGVVAAAGFIVAAPVLLMAGLCIL